MIYKNKNFGDTKYYMIIENPFGTSELIEYANGCERTRLSMNEEQMSNFMTMLEKNDWKKQ